MILYLVCDTSGSMAEWGKHFIAQGIIRAIEQYVRLGYGNAQIKLIAWGDETRIIDWDPDDELPLKNFTLKGSANAKNLIALIPHLQKDKVVLITDGFWLQSDAKALKCWKQSLPPDTIRIIKVGPDANPLLKGPDVFTSEELFAALDSWWRGDGV